jgi:hypothetical protein
LTTCPATSLLDQHNIPRRTQRHLDTYLTCQYSTLPAVATSAPRRCAGIPRQRPTPEAPHAHTAPTPSYIPFMPRAHCPLSLRRFLSRQNELPSIFSRRTKRTSKWAICPWSLRRFLPNQTNSPPPYDLVPPALMPHLQNKAILPHAILSCSFVWLRGKATPLRETNYTLSPPPDSQ